ncbi:MAG: dihydropteroate synthase [Winogradskyella sp.]|nr:dihydropteroate synthase [Winogradskyella sp.]NNK40601.1 dihydropteroate synthase [Winogradskyella sp.]NNL83441.1 dihydropteroate synthase [Winogradskyella sp.]
MTINCKGQLIDLTSPKVMGILNVTPDSFYDGGTLTDNKTLLTKVESMLNDGVTFIDVGGYSSRPGAEDIAVEEELNRVIPKITLILKHFPEVPISVDTFRRKVAEEAISCGAAMVNDISAGHLDDQMIPTVGRLGVPYIMMHMRGTPQTMKQLTVYNDLIKELNLYFAKQIALAVKHNINDIIIDPGFGFAKTIDQNFELLKHLELLKISERPVLAGVSRKSMIYKTLNATSKQAQNGTTALNMLALNNGASILRVHDVKEAMECVTLFNELSKY